MTPPSPVKIGTRVLVVAAALLALPGTGAAAGTAARLADGPLLSIHTTTAGAHQVRYEDLVSEAPGAPSGPWPSAGLGLTNRGARVPIWIEDGGDGLFGAGDSFEFVAQILPGTHGALHEYSPSNVYLLSVDAVDPARMTSDRGTRPSAPRPAARRDYSDSLHLEVDTLLMRFGCRKEANHELWYWHKLASVDETAFLHDFEIPGLDRGRGKVTLEIDLHGWSQLHRRDDLSVTDHRMQIFLNETLLHEEAWNGKTTHRVTLPDVDPALLRAGSNTLGLRVPGRRDAEGRLIADAVVLNWLRIHYPRTARVQPDRQAHYRLPPGVRGGLAVLESPGPLRVYAADGTRFDLPAAGDGPARGSATRLEIPARRSIYVAPAGTLHRPERVVPFNGARLAALGQQADYITIAHRDLKDAIEPLMQYRRAQGLSVQVVSLDEVYDAYNDGIPHPTAIREFLRQAYETWPRPAPRFVLLVGDASWDSKHEDPRLENYAFKTGPLQNHGVGRAEGTRYDDATVNDRGLIPTFNYLTRAGHAASDNWFVSFDDDPAPEMAIGRFPVVSAQEVADITRKTIAHERAGAGAWRKSTLWITNEQPGFQNFSDQLAASFSERGYAAHKIYPRSGEAGNAQRIVDALDQGQFLVYFYGHGGRFIWRTSPADLSQNRDLFSLDDLDRLSPTVNTPVVMSFTCYSAPFDHPSEDSIGEKLVRIEGRGAVAVIAASWRNAPSLTIQKHYLNAIADAATLGEAMVEAKSRIASPLVVETYNLLGDPALRLLGVRPVEDAAAISGTGRPGS